MISDINISNIRNIIELVCKKGKNAWELALYMSKNFILKACETNTFKLELLHAFKRACDNSGFSGLTLSDKDKKIAILHLETIVMDPMLHVFLRETISYAFAFATCDVMIEPSLDWKNNPLKGAYRFLHSTAWEMWNANNKLLKASHYLETLTEKHGQNFEACLKEDGIQEALADFLKNKDDIKKNVTTWNAFILVGIMMSAVGIDYTVDGEHRVFHTAFAYWRDNAMSLEQLETPIEIFDEVLADKPTELECVKQCFKAFFTRYPNAN